VTTPAHWWIFASLSCLTLAALTVAALARVEITSRARGILRPAGGVQALRAEASGLVDQILVRSGEQVVAGQELITIDAREMRAELAQTQRRLSFVERQLSHLEESDKALHEVEVGMLRERARLTGQRVKSQRTQVAALEARRTTYSALGQKGLVPALEAERMGDALGLARREELTLLDDLARTRGELGSLLRSREQQLWSWSEERYRAEAELARARERLEQAVIRAPRAGVVEALSVKPRERIEVGALLAKLVAAGPVTEVAVFLPERDRAFVKRGQRVRIELDRLPMEEFGVLHARVTEVADEMADRAELLDTLGQVDDSMAHVHRVDLVLEADARSRSLQSRLRSGALLSARFALRERRLLALLFDPLRRWLE